jgi:hypothetical protein
MCPGCIASVVLVVAGVMSTGGVTALAAKLLHSKKSAQKILFEEPKEKEN